MLGQVGHNPQPDVRQRADGEGYLFACEPADESVVLEAPYAVVDALGVEKIERLPDVAGPDDALARSVPRSR